MWLGFSWMGTGAIAAFTSHPFCIVLFFVVVLSIRRDLF